MRGGASSFSLGDVEVRVSASCKSHHFVSQGEEDCLLSAVLDVRRGGGALFEEAELRLLRRRSYALVGANGAGKTTLLRVLEHLQRERVHLVAQFEEEEEEKSVFSDDSAFSFLLHHDSRLLRAAALLEDCVEDELAQVAAEVETLEENAGERARAALRRVGFRKRIQREETKLKTLSGGWKMRARLAVALNSGAQVLLLDEPTTSLDSEGIEMLEAFMRETYDDMCFVVVSHNRAFLERTCSDVLLLQHKSLQHFPMSFEAFWAVSAEKTTRKQHQFDKQEVKVQELKRQVAVLQSTASKGHSNVAGAISARKKKLEQIEEGTCNKHENGKRYHRFSVKTFFYQYGPNVSGKLQPPMLPRPPRWNLAQPSSCCFGRDEVLIGLEDAVIGHKTALLSIKSLAIRSGTKLLIQGRNGTGKSTLLRSIAGDIPLLSGTRTVSHRARIGYYSQLAGQELGGVVSSPLDFIMETCNLPEREARSRLVQFGIQNELFAHRVCDLSGGQRVRLVFAKLCAFEPHMLLLDEPETHLDLLTIAQLFECLSNNWNEGALVMISHDDYLADICNEWITVGEEIEGSVIH